MKVKILDADLIRRYGGVIVEMNEGTANNLQKQGKVKIIDVLPEKELPDTGTVLVFSEMGKENKKESKMDKKRIPDVNEPIFPQIKS